MSRLPPLLAPRPHRTLLLRLLHRGGLGGPDPALERLLAPLPAATDLPLPLDHSDSFSSFPGSPPVALRVSATRLRMILRYARGTFWTRTISSPMLAFTFPAGPLSP